MISVDCKDGLSLPMNLDPVSDIQLNLKHELRCAQLFEMLKTHKVKIQYTSSLK